MLDSRKKEMKNMEMREYLKSMVYTREEVDDWFSGTASPFQDMIVS